VASERIDCKFCKNRQDYVKLIRSRLIKIFGIRYNHNKSFEENNQIKIYFLCCYSNTTRCKSRCLAVVDLNRQSAELYLKDQQHNHRMPSMLKNIYWHKWCTIIHIWFNYFKFSTIGFSTIFVIYNIIFFILLLELN
jgi:hypothetical protein